MKKLLFFLSLISFIAGPFFALANLYSPIDPIAGAWGHGSPEARTIIIITEKIISVTTYNLPEKKFIGSQGGTWHQSGDQIMVMYEWNSKDSSQVGKEMSTAIRIKDDKLLFGESAMVFDRIDKGPPGVLSGAWIISGNYVNDLVSKRNNPFYPRRTMKILSGNYFQWIAYNVVTKQFIATGGGSYTTENGKYTEQIDYFTKTAESVGKQVVFEYSFVNGDWRHKGQKSTGGPLDECWSRREIFEK